MERGESVSTFPITSILPPYSTALQFLLHAPSLRSESHRSKFEWPRPSACPSSCMITKALAVLCRIIAPPLLVGLPTRARPDQIHPVSGARIIRYLFCQSVIPNWRYVSERIELIQAVKLNPSQDIAAVRRIGTSRLLPKEKVIEESL